MLAASSVLSVTLDATGPVQAICDPADGAKVVTVAPGQLLTLYGVNLASAGGGAATPSNGVTVTFNGIAAPILYASGGQINLQVPYEIAGQTQATMQVSSQSVTPPVAESYYLGVATRQPSVFVAAASFAAPFFDSAVCNGQVLAGVQALALNADGSVNSCANPAATGPMVTVFLQGLGVTVPAQSTGAISESVAAVAPPAALVPFSSSSLPVALATATLDGQIAAVVGVQVPAPAASSVLHLELVDPQNGVTYLVRGPGIVIWTASPQ